MERIVLEKKERLAKFKEFLLTYCRDEKGNVDLSGLNLSDFKMAVRFTNWKVGGSFSNTGLKAKIIYQSFQEADEINQSWQKTVFLIQNHSNAYSIDQDKQCAESVIWQNQQKAEYIFQDDLPEEEE